MKKLLLLSLLSFSARTTVAQSLYFPPVAGNGWDTLSPASLGWCSPQIDSLYQLLQANDTKAFILLKNGKIVLEKYFGTQTASSVWYWASAGKTLTAFMVGLAQQEGFLKIADTTSKYLGAGWTSCTPAQEAAITVRHQLTMTSGLDDGSNAACTLPSCLTYKAPAGMRWAYHNGPYTLLDSVVENATGRNLSQYVAQKLTPVTGIAGTYITSGYNHVFGSTARSMARYGLLILGRGKWNNTPVLTDTAYFGQMTRPSQAINKSYGYLWWLNGQASYMLPAQQTVFNGVINPDAPPDMICALGKNGQFINVVRSQNLVWIRMGNEPTSVDVPFELNNEIWKRINKLPCSTSGMKSIGKDRLEVFPNPAAGGIFTVVAEGLIEKIRVTDIVGKTVLQQEAKGATKAEIDLTGQPAGVYLLQVQTAGRGYAQQLIVE